MSNNIPAWSLSWILLGISLYEYTASTTKMCLDKLSLIFDILFSPRLYVFFKGYIQPVPFRLNIHFIAQLQTKNQNQNNSDEVSSIIMYDIDKSLFFPYRLNQSIQNICSNKRKSLSILSLEIIDSSKKAHYDLSEFVEKIKYIGDIDLNLSHILMAWSISSAVLPDTERFVLRYIDMSGDSFETCTLFENRASLTIS